MTYDFDQLISREHTACEKLDSCEAIFNRKEVIPMWIADMDFAVADPILKAIETRAKHPILGYTYRNDDYFGSIVGWVKRRNGWDISPEWIDFCPGVVPGVVFALWTFTQPGDGVVIQPPVYHPFARQTKANDRRVIDNPMRLTESGRYEIDFEDLDQKLAGAKVFLMSNPQNPTGRVYTPEELLRIGELCIKHDVLILSDEIHSDLIYAPHHHTHIASLSEQIAERTITFIAPSKTFNIAGLSTAVVIIPNPTLRRRYIAECGKLHAEQGNIFGTEALKAAYNEGEEWLDQLLPYLKGNCDYVVEFLKENLPSVRCHCPEGTYLLWLDLRDFPLSEEQTNEFLIHKAGLGMNRGSMFGEQGSGWWRMNIATPRSVVKQAMEQLLAAYNALEA